MFHKKGNIFHGGSQDLVSAVEYREAVRSALTYELGGAGRAAKATIKWTGVSERTAKNWIAGSYGPSGEHLIGLMKHSDAVLDVVLQLAGRNEALAMERVRIVRRELVEVLKMLDEVCVSQSEN
ncbi:XRE family transcriptional regulator [Thalassobius sp. S69A]|uniref:XRE family transcriptional regulator n=1 Tax=unclassified Thalassovita TaxID=2619711 RepID=UPI003C797BB8|tara:strand:- start:413 stop:784 length:372 start_codon:yes stop_codon:yes gene_type:complete